MNFIICKVAELVFWIILCSMALRSVPYYFQKCIKATLTLQKYSCFYLKLYIPSTYYKNSNWSCTFLVLCRFGRQGSIEIFCILPLRAVLFIFSWIKQTQNSFCKLYSPHKDIFYSTYLEYSRVWNKSKHIFIDDPWWVQF